ncbi:MAG: tetratricopeptide repeat protein [Isosphaeraceae bacterium]|nr:tetratricopeptide repeat protein [Isosphaeraceae bacterium]
MTAMPRRLAPVLAGIVLVALAGATFAVVTHSRRRLEAEAAYTRGNLLEALRLSLDHLEFQPWDREASRLAALCLSRLDFAAEAEPHYAAAGGTSRLSVDEAQIRAFALVRAGRLDQAVAAYREILERRPNDPLALQRLATTYLTMKRYPDALEIAGRLAGLLGFEVIGDALLGTIAHQDGVPEDAAAAYQRVFESDPTLARLPFERSVFWSEFIVDLLESGRGADASRYLAAGLASTPDDPLLLTLAGRASFQVGEIDAAERSWKRALEVDTRRARAYLGLGQIALKRGDVPRARESLERALSLGPDDFEAAYQLSLVLGIQGDAEGARRYRELARTLRIKAGIPERGMGAMPASMPAPTPNAATSDSKPMP